MFKAIVALSLVVGFITGSIWLVFNPQWAKITCTICVAIQGLYLAFLKNNERYAH